MRTVASRVVVSTDAVIPLAAGISLKPHERVTAQQEKDSDIGLALPPALGVEVMAAPSAADLGGLFAPDTLLDCATCLWVAGAEPGATVTLAIGAGAPLASTAVGNFVTFGLPAGTRLHSADAIVVEQSACALDGPGRTLAKPVDQVRATWPAPPPTLGPLVRCQRAVQVGGVIPGATVVVTVNADPAQTYSAGFVTKSETFWLPRPLAVGDKVSVLQRFELCELTSRASTSTATDAVPPRPWVERPLCEGDRQVRVTALLVGAQVQFRTDTGHTWAAGAPDGDTTLGVPR
jgi:hypothetical protein